MAVLSPRLPFFELRRVFVGSPLSSDLWPPWCFPVPEQVFLVRCVTCLTLMSTFLFVSSHGRFDSRDPTKRAHFYLPAVSVCPYRASYGYGFPFPVFQQGFGVLGLLCHPSHPAVDFFVCGISRQNSLRLDSFSSQSRLIR